MVGSVNFAQFFSTLKSAVHLLTLTETWLSNYNLDPEIQIVGYDLHITDRKTKGEGVAVHVR